MKLFSCPNCGHRLYFENVQCLNCANFVIFDPERAEFVLSTTEGVIICTNVDECGCNWRALDGQDFCRACSLNKIIPDLSIPGNRERWTRVEFAKKRAIYSLLAYGLPVQAKQNPNDEAGLAFDFLAGAAGSGPGGEHVLTGHDSGLITLNVAEADSAEREKMRVQMGESYRTLLGHFRHELGHYYWDRLIRDDQTWLDRFRGLFGDERADYTAALQKHYGEGAPPDWQLDHISPYATVHPWEDWAESWAHYVHITDTLEMVHALNLPLGRLEPTDERTLERSDTAADSMPSKPGETARLEPFEKTLERWLVLSVAFNSINRCMGLPDLYPFVISPGAAAKLAFVHDVIGSVRPPDH
jgi:hypothetical protein